ncbi:MAG: hypothetical protein JXB00_01460 [Bacteroidales bacterium]|nr:hypothetical protein [Bacteroidales bacterium]
MSDKFQNEYRIPSARLQNWNYGWNASCFVTICNKDREHFFGEIQNGTMQYSPAGIIANVLWYEIKNHAKNTELGEFVVMPNHVHSIIILNGDNSGDVDNADLATIAETTHALSLQPQIPSTESPSSTGKTIGQQRFQNQGKNTLSSIVGGYKSAVTKHCNRLGFISAWQSRFHDHIIRDKQSFQKISEYIKNNLLNWPQDKFYNQ